MLRRGCGLARLAPVAWLVLLAATGCTGQDCKAIGLDGPLVIVAVPKEFADGATTFRVCADTSCRDGLVPSWGGGDYVVSFVQINATWGRSVVLTLAGTGNRNVNAAITVRTHAFYPGCIETPVAAARFNSATGRLEPSDYSFNHSQA
jgi:hypothetical protein